MRVVIVTKIFPSGQEPLSSPFNRQQFAALARLCDVEVLGTIPWFPGARMFSRWSLAGRQTEVPRVEVIDGVPVAHPRFLFVPRIGHDWSAALYTASLVPAVLRRRGRVDVVLGSWAYPDGVAAVRLGRLLGVPTVVKVHGSDLNVVAKLPGPRRILAQELPRASRVVAVSRALGDEAVGLGVSPARVKIVGNGVDSALFHPRDRVACRARLGLLADGKRVVYVGRLEPAKGVIDLLDAFSRPELAGVALSLVGDGGAREACQARAAVSGGRITVHGARPLDEIPDWMGAADVLTLPSWNEGTPNVILEALACGRPVVGTTVGGIPDLLDAPLLGRLVPPRDPGALATALAEVAGLAHDAGAIAARGARGGWAESAQKLFAVLEEAVKAGRR